MKKTLLAVVFIVCKMFASGQQTGNDIPIDLTSVTPVIDTNGLAAIHSVSLQAITPDTSVIGYISDTASATTYTLVPASQLTNWMQTYIETTYNPHFSDAGKSVYWIIRSFSLSESISSSRVYVHLEASLFTGAAGNTNAQWDIDTLLSFPHQAGDNYAIPYQNALQTLLSYSAGKISPSAASRSVQNIRSRPRTGGHTTARDYSGLPIIKDSIVNEGAFLTLGQFANNNPSVTNIIIVADDSSTTGKVRIYHMNDDSTRQELTSVVAVCIEGEIYGYRNRQIIALERTNNSMLISRYRDPAERQNQAIYMRNILSDSPGNENPFNKEYKCTKPGYQDVVATCIDLDTGDLSF